MIGKLEDGRIIKLENASIAELKNGEWVSPSAPISGEDLWNADELGESELIIISNCVELK